jgi:hypothetical protein
MFSIAKAEEYIDLISRKPVINRLVTYDKVA